MQNRFIATAMCLSTVLLLACGGSGGGESAETKSYVRGPVTGFGSVIISSVRYDTGSAQFEVDDRPGSESELEIGQIVEILARGGKAVRVSYDAELEGPVTSVDPTNNLFVALGQTVIVESTTVFEGTSLDTLVAGDRVEVSGELDANGDLHAAYVELMDDQGEDFEVKGTVTGHDPGAQTFSLNALTVDYSAAVLDPPDLLVADGQFLEVEGSLSGSSLIATEVELEDRADNLAELEGEGEIELEGFVELVSSPRTFVLNGFTVSHVDDTEFEGGSAADIAPNARLEVEGQLDAEGTVVAESIEFESPEERELVIEIEAPAQAVDGQSVTVLGIDLQVADSTRVRDSRDDNDRFSAADIQPGDFLEISAYMKDGSVVAGVIEREEDSEEGVGLSAPISDIDEAANMITVLGVPVDVSAAEFEIDDSRVSRSEFFAAAAVDTTVDVEGSFDGSLIVASQVELDDEEETGSTGD